MKFYLKKDKQVTGERGNVLTFVEAGVYEVMRIFDEDRIIVNINHGHPKQLTLLRTRDGELGNE